MTPLKPTENRLVRAVASERYPPNTKCAHPECSEPVTDNHHCFPRSQIKGDSWFVEITYMSDEDGNTSERTGVAQVAVIPHVTGLCRAHHDAVEKHDAWIRLEDGQFVWYDRAEVAARPHSEENPDWQETWIDFGPLNPQPGSREGKAKRKRFQGEARKKRRTISVKVPDDSAENGGEVWDIALERAAEKLGRLRGEDGPDERPAYHILVDAINDWLDIRDEVSLSG